VPRASAYIVLAACCFSTIPIFVSLALREGAPLAAVLLWRYAAGAALLLAAGGGLAAMRIPRPRAMRLLVLGGAGQVAVAMLSLSALRWIPAGTLAFLFYTYPAWIAVIAAISRTDRLTRTRLLALAFSLGGIALMVGMPGAESLAPAGVALALVAALTYAFYVPMLERLGDGIAPSVAATYITGGAGVLLLAGGLGVALLADDPLGRWVLLPGSVRVWGAVAGLATISTLTAFLLYLRGLAALGPVRTSILSTVEPFSAAILGAIMLDQPFGAGTMAGGALIAGAIWLLQRPAGAGRRSDL
jgi:drug/metabolite transporter (DMT)-like permease